MITDAVSRVPREGAPRQAGHDNASGHNINDTLYASSLRISGRQPYASLSPTGRACLSLFNGCFIHEFQFFTCRRFHTDEMAMMSSASRRHDAIFVSEEH